MQQELEAVFDGKVLQLEVPLNLAAGTRVRIIVESVLPNEVKQPKTFLQTAQSLELHGDPDWSEKIDLTADTHFRQAGFRALLRN